MPAKPELVPLPVFRPGDIVKIRADQLVKRRKPGTFTPADLCRIGWPNRFQVLAASETEKGALLTLDPCCRWMENPATGQFLCAAHPAEYFEPELSGDAARKKRRPGRQLVVRTPLGDAFRLEYSEDAEEPGLTVQVGSGAPVELGGAISRLLGEKLKEGGLI